MYRAILLDVYGTLVHDDESHLEAVVADVAARAGVDPQVAADEWNGRLYALADDAHGPRFRTLADLYAASLTETATHFGVRLDARDALRGRTALRPPLFADTRTFLAALTVPVCLVSDADRADLDAVLAHHAITVEAIVTSEDARAYKPRPEPFERALALLGLGPAEVVHVGNSLTTDVAGAAALGIDTALVTRDTPTSAATYTAGSLTALLPHLR